MKMATAEVQTERVSEADLDRAIDALEQAAVDYGCEIVDSGENSILAQSANHKLTSARAKVEKVLHALLTKMEAALLLAGDALARYEIAHNQDKGSWSLEALHVAEEVACIAQAAIDKALAKSEGK
jgi:hypothetical protein